MKNLIKFLLLAGLTFASCPAFTQNYNLQFRSSLTFPGQTLANICGYTQGGKEYALLGASKGLIIVDITNPDAPQEIVQIPGPDNLWKEIKTYSHYAYVTSEGGQGLQIVDLSDLPSATLNSHFYTGDGAINGQLNAIHALHIDVKKGFLYAFGGGLFQGGAKIFNLNNDPYNPTYVGKFDQLGYVHDGFAENDTLYAAHINAGILSIVDMSNKSNPVVLGTVNTPGSFTHNAWLLDDHKRILTTDEKFPSFVTAYDVSDPENIQELDRVSTTRDGVNSIGHNTHILNDWAITSWYTDGLTIVDAHRPENLVEVGRFDTWPSPVNLNDPFDGCWGVYPYFPSGTVVTSNIEPGVFNVLTPTYVRACYLEGTIINGCNGFPMSGANIAVNTTEVRVNTTTKPNGEFKTGQVTPGSYTATISKPGFITQTIDFTFTTGEVTILNATLVPEAVVTLSGTVIDENTQLPIANAPVRVFSGAQSFDFRTDNNGQFNEDCVAADTYQASVGAWGYLSKTVSFVGSAPLNVALEPFKYYDDFQVNLGWENASTATSGQWELGEPIGTFTNNGAEVNPENDANVDNSDQCYVTGNGGGGQGDDDVDNGSVTLTSPTMDLTGSSSAKLSFYYWFYNGGGSGNPNDKLQVNLLIDGQPSPIFSQNISSNAWRFSGQITLPPAALSSSNVRVEFVAADDAPGHLLESAVDIFKIDLVATSGTNSPQVNALITAAPNPSRGDFQVQYSWNDAPEMPFFEVRNLLGQVVYSEKLQTKSGTLACGSNWIPGIYFATLNCSGKKGIPMKLVKE